LRFALQAAVSAAKSSVFTLSGATARPLQAAFGTHPALYVPVARRTFVGAILEAGCPCGFHRSDLFVGGGMLEEAPSRGGPGVCALPALCPRCGRMFLANYLGPTGGAQAAGGSRGRADPPACPACHQELYFYTESALQGEPLREGGKRLPDVFCWSLQGPEGEEEIRLPAVRYLCPACGKKTLEFRESGAWD
jgi:hypothetical protein